MAPGRAKFVAEFAGTFLLVLFAAGAVVAILLARKYHLFGTMAVAFGRDMSKAETDDDAEKVKALHAQAQDILGVRTLVDKALTLAKAKA